MLRYRLDDLGWYQFECMVQSLLKSSLGLGIESWAGRGDQGRDVYFKGKLKFPVHTEFREGPFIFQMKFIEEANAAGVNPRSRIVAAVKSEIKRIRKRKSLTGKNGIYVLYTNAFLSPELRDELRQILSDNTPFKEIFIMGGQDLCDLLDKSPHIRVSFPQILSLRDLDNLLLSIVAKPIIERSKGMIEEAREISPVFYPTSAYNETLKKLTDHHFAVLEGPPEVGKTAIARIIGLSRLSLGWEAHECLQPNDIFQLYDNEKRQIFIADDAFGSTEYDPARTTEWSHNLDRILRCLDQHHWLIWTDRKHILEIALERMRLQGKGESFPEPGSIIVDAGNLTIIEKSMILYRHAKASLIESASRNLLREYAVTIVSSTHFTPERIRRFIRQSFPHLIADYNLGKLTKEILGESIIKEIREPTKVLRQAFNCLSEGHKKLLISRLDLDRTNKYFFESTDFSQAFDRHRPTVLDKSYEQLEGELVLSFLKLSSYGEGWIHPSIRDLVINFLVENKSYRLDFLSKCSISGISLALSIGGDEERRIFPLVKDIDDQEIIKKRIEKLIVSMASEKLESLLETIRELKIKSEELENPEIIKFADEVFENAINIVLARWDKGKEVITNDLLKLYYKMIENSKTFRPTPPLENTWNFNVSRITEALEHISDYIKQADFSYFLEFLDLIELLNSEEPRFLKHEGFQDFFISLASKFIKQCIDYAQSDYDIIVGNNDEEYDIFSSEAKFYKEIHEIIERIMDLSINLQLELSHEKISELIEDSIEKWEERAKEAYIPDDDFDDDYGGSGSQPFNVQEIFSDL